jgi:hypothetical protein
MRTRNLALTFATTLLAGACTVGAAGGGPGPGDDSAGDDAPATGQVSGAITSDTTWSGTIEIVGDVTVNSGATLTIEPGTMLTADDGRKLDVAGTLDAIGTDADHISILAAGTTWAGIVVESGGAAHVAYADGQDVATLLYCHAGATLCQLEHVNFTSMGQAIVAEGTASLEASHVGQMANGGVAVTGSGNLHVVDSTIIASSGDLVVGNGGTLLVEYSEIGDTQGAYDHCDFHVGSASSLTITHSNIINGVYGIMLGGTTGAQITYNNWMGNTTDLDPIGSNATVNMQHNYWQNGTPTPGSGYDLTNPEAAQIADAGPRL